MRHAHLSLGVAAWAIAAGLAGEAAAFDARRSTARGVIADELTALAAANVGALRGARELRFGATGLAAWRAFVVATGGTWSVAWDRATHVPTRIWGSGIAAPGANGSPAIAEAFARRVLGDHLALFAPGARVDDFALVANHHDPREGIRSVGFVQRHRGRAVVGGQLSFRFRDDRLFVIASEAVPDIRVDEPRVRMGRPALLARATVRLRDTLALPDAPVAVIGDEVVLPLVGRDSIYGFRVVAQLVVEGGADGRYLAYVDPTSGEPVAVQQTNRYATGTVRYRGVDRHPGRGRVDRPASRARVTVGGAPQTTGVDGTVTMPETPSSVTTSVVGDLVRVETVALGSSVATADLPIAPGGSVVWDASADGERDAQVVTFLATNAAKEYVRAQIDPSFPRLDVPIVARVNHDRSCNAYYDGQSINFFHATVACQNTGLVEDIVYHEYGHALHDGEIVEGVGALDVALAEGVADFFAASITGDPGTARGFDYTDAALRHLDETEERVWPRDIAEAHQTGMIVGGALWDLRKGLIASLGETAGIARTNRILLGILRRASSIPTALIEALAADDDDGNLANGTPNECAIRAAFGRHGLRTASGVVDAPGLLPASADTETTVRLAIDGLSACPADTIDRALLVWSPSLITNVPVPGAREMTLESPGSYAGALPLPDATPIFYGVKVYFADGSVAAYADNLADPAYQLYRGDTVALYCTSFEEADGDPFANGWTTGTGNDDPSPWQWGVPTGSGTDPPAAFTGQRVLAQALDGTYPARQISWVALPPVDAGTWTDVRLQYRRWLAVEDSHGDLARITSWGEQAWITGSRDSTRDLHHLDREWRFHDVPLSSYAPANIIDVRFELTSNAMIEFGGWAIDDVCIVANTRSICGDGVKSPTEQCDDGAANGDGPDACRAYCKRARCGDAVVDSAEECDDGGETTYCSATCTSYVAPQTAGCCSGASGLGSIWLAGWDPLESTCRHASLSIL